MLVRVTVRVLLLPTATSPKLRLVGLIESSEDGLTGGSGLKLPPPQAESKHTTAMQAVILARAPASEKELLQFFARLCSIFLQVIVRWPTVYGSLANQLWILMIHNTCRIVAATTGEKANFGTESGPVRRGTSSVDNEPGLKMGAAVSRRSDLSLGSPISAREITVK